MPHLIVIAGPNGAGKSSAAPGMLDGLLGIEDFVNADLIARGLSAFNPQGAALEAGRIMLARLRELAAQRRDFAFETTLASRTFARWIVGLRNEGYQFRLNYVWISSPELSIARIRGRVAEGGHHVPDEVVRRRYVRGVRNLFELYLPISDLWRVYDNSAGTYQLRVVAEGHRGESPKVYNQSVWKTLQEQAGR